MKEIAKKSLIRKPKILPDEERARRQAVWDAKVSELEADGATIKPDLKDMGVFAYIATIPFESGIVVTIRFCLEDWQTDSDVVITNMTTLPDTKIRKGFGRKGLAHILNWARRHRLTEIRATQVREDNRGFWEKNGFTLYPEPNPCKDLVLHIINNAH